MTNDEKRSFLQALEIELAQLAGKHGDIRPTVSVQIVDTDPAPMSGPYVQAVLSFKALLPTK